MRNVAVEKKRLMVLGGGPNQVPLIKAAKSEGYKVILVDYTNDHPGIPLADTHYQVSYRDVEAVIAIARDETIGGVVSNSETAIPYVARISEELGLPGNSVESVDRLRNKHSFRKLQREAGLLSPSSFRASTYEEVAVSLSSLAMPVIMKPSESSGTRGTTILKSIEDIDLGSTFDECAKYSLDKTITVEEYVEMPSLSVIEGDVFVCDGEFLWCGFFTDVRASNLPFVPMTNILPIDIDGIHFDILKRSVADVLDSAGITLGQFNVEAYFDNNDRLFIIEINARQGGNGIPRIIRQSCGVDMDRLLVTTACGDMGYWNEVNSKRPSTRYVTSHMVFPDQSGILRNLVVDEKVREFQIESFADTGDGAFVGKAENAAGRIARIVFEFPDRETQLRHSYHLDDLVICEIEPSGVGVADRSFPTEHLYRFLQKVDEDFTTPLSMQAGKTGLTLRQYAEKLCTKGTIAYEAVDGEIAGVVIGYAHDTPDGGSYITQIAVSKNYRGQGVCGRILGAYLAHCREMKLDYAWLTTATSNLPAQRAYEKAGFESCGAENDLVRYRIDLNTKGA